MIVVMVPLVVVLVQPIHYDNVVVAQEMPLLLPLKFWTISLV